MSPPRGPCADFQFGFLKSAYCVGNINTAKSLQKSRKQIASRGKRSPTLDIGSYLDYNIYVCISILTKRKAIHFIHYHLLRRKKYFYFFFRYFHHLGWPKLCPEVLITTTSMWILLNLTGCGSLRGDFQQLRYSIIRLCCSCL